MALSIYDVLYHSQNDKYPEIVKSFDSIQGITPVVDQEGTELFGFYRPSTSGKIAPNGLPEGEIGYVKKTDLENYSQRVFGHELPEIIDSHRVTTQHGESQIQSPSATKGADPRYSRVKAGGINENHGWKIHADLVQDQDYDQAMASIGRSSDHSIADKSVAEAFDKRLRNLGMETDDFLQHFKRLGTDPRNGNVKFINPQDLATSMEVFERHGVTYKMTALTYGEGRHITAYPQSIVNRDKLITDMENSLGQRLVDQNDLAYRSRLGPEVGVKNHPLSRGVSGRFTTDYLEVDPSTGKVDFSLSDTGNPAPEEYKISGKISPEEIKTINRVNAEMPEMAELLHGPNGYVSPYRTIEQIAQDRVSGAINLSHTINSSRVDANSPHGLAFAPVGGVVHNPQRNPLPPINKPGQVSAPGTLPPTSAPSVAAVPSAAPTALTKTSEKSKIAPNFKYYNDPNYNPDVFFGDNEHTVRAFHPDTGEEMGKLSFYGKGGMTPGEIDKIEVAEKFRRQGIGTGLLEEARRLSTVDENVPYVVHSKSRTPDGEAWARSTGDTLPERTGSFDDLVEPSAPAAPVANELIESKIVKAIENPTADEYADARARGDLIATETYDHGAEVSKATASGEVLVEPPPPKTTTPPPASGKPEKQGIRVGSSSKIKTTPDPHGSAPSTPPPPNGKPINTGRTNRSRYNKPTKSCTKHSTIFRRTI